MKIIFKKLILALVVSSSFNGRCLSQASAVDYLYGEWKKVKVDNRGYQKLSKAQAEEISNSVLVIEKNQVFYRDIRFMKPCTFYEIKIGKHDWNKPWGISLENRYTKNELSKMDEVAMVNQKGERTCFNDCAIFFIKQDTLIHICGGYTFYLTKETKR